MLDKAKEHQSSQNVIYVKKPKTKPKKQQTPPTKQTNKQKETQLTVVITFLDIYMLNVRWRGSHGVKEETNLVFMFTCIFSWDWKTESKCCVDLQVFFASPGGPGCSVLVLSVLCWFLVPSVVMSTLWCSELPFGSLATLLDLSILYCPETLLYLDHLLMSWVPHAIHWCGEPTGVVSIAWCLTHFLVFWAPQVS